MMSEASAYRTLRDAIKQPGDRLDRIENLVGSGFPDTNGCFNGIEFWMEIKAPTEPKRATTKLFGSNHKLSQDQMNWFLRQRRANGLGFVYIETDHARMLIDGSHADRVNDLTTKQLMTIAVWVASRPTPIAEWLDLRDLIANHV